MSLRMLSLKQVLVEVDTTANTLRLWIKAGRFPAPIYLPSGEKRWLEVDVLRWQMGLQSTPPGNPVKRKTDAHQGAPKRTQAQSEKSPKTPE